MKINQIIINESSCGGSTAGSIATVSKPLGEVQKRVPVVKTSKKKGPYANSLSEGKMKDLSLDMGKNGLSDIEFKKKYGKTKDEMRKELQKKPEPKDKPMSEAKLEEEDKIIPVGKGKKLKTGLHGKDAQPKFTGLMPPFKSAGVFVSDKRGNKVCDCAAQELAPVIAKALNAYAVANEDIMSGGLVASGMPGESVQEGLPPHIKPSDIPPTMRNRKLTMKDIEAERPKGAYRYRVGEKEFLDLSAAKQFAAGTNQKVEPLSELSPETIKSYKEKARKSADELKAKKQFRKATDREMGIMRATGKEMEKTIGDIRKALGKK